MREVRLIGKATEWSWIEIEFGRTQAELSFSPFGSIQRKLKLKEGDKVEVIIRKVK